jgi:hypothetical protein
LAPCGYRAVIFFSGARYAKNSEIYHPHKPRIEVALLSVNRGDPESV